MNEIPLGRGVKSGYDCRRSFPRSAADAGSTGARKAAAVAAVLTPAPDTTKARRVEGVRDSGLAKSKMATTRAIVKHAIFMITVSLKDSTSKREAMSSTEKAAQGTNGRKERERERKFQF